MSKELEIAPDPQDAHGCASCYEINQGFYRTVKGHKVCILCGGKILGLQEAFDEIARLQVEVEDARNYWNP